VSYLEMAKRARAELRQKRPNDITQGKAPHLVVTSFRSSPASAYAHPWPDVLPGLGGRRVGPFDQCACCWRWSWVRYGRVVLCLTCACRRATEPVA
jgi:hypothetical protein